LDTIVASAMRSSLATLNRAIVESREAVLSDPTSEVARITLFGALQKKVEVLQATALIIEDMDRSGGAGLTRVVGASGRGL
jgi:hypothetical protein